MLSMSFEANLKNKISSHILLSLYNNRSIISHHTFIIIFYNAIIEDIVFDSIQFIKWMFPQKEYFEKLGFDFLDKNMLVSGICKWITITELPRIKQIDMSTYPYTDDDDMSTDSWSFLKPKNQNKTELHRDKQFGMSTDPYTHDSWFISNLMNQNKIKSLRQLLCLSATPVKYLKTILEEKIISDETLKLIDPDLPIGLKYVANSYKILGLSDNSILGHRLFCLSETYKEIKQCDSMITHLKY